MELNFTLRESIKFEKATNCSLFKWIKDAQKTPESITMGDLFLLFKLGAKIDDEEKAYDAFDAWDAPIEDKLKAICESIGDFKKKQNRQ
jgi:hypothetical protein